MEVHYSAVQQIVVSPIDTNFTTSIAKGGFGKFDGVTIHDLPEVQKRTCLELCVFLAWPQADHWAYDSKLRIWSLPKGTEDAVLDHSGS